MEITMELKIFTSSKEYRSYIRHSIQVIIIMQLGVCVSKGRLISTILLPRAVPCHFSFCVFEIPYNPLRICKKHKLYTQLQCVRGTGRIRFFKIKINSLGWPRFSDKCAGPNRCCKRPTGPLRQRDEDFSSKNWSTARIALRHPGLNPGPVRGEGPRPNPILRVRRAAVTGHCRGPQWHEVCGEFSLQFREQGPGPVAPRGGTSDGPSPRRLRGQGQPVRGDGPGPCQSASATGRRQGPLPLSPVARASEVCF